MMKKLLLLLALLPALVTAQVQPTVDNTPATLSNKVISGASNTISAPIQFGGVTALNFPVDNNSQNATLAGVDAGTNISAAAILSNCVGDHSCGSDWTGTTVPTIASVAITGTAGQFSCTCLTISGTYGGTGSITGYTNPTNYTVSATDGVSTFTLKTTATPGSVAIVTTAGTPTGLSYVVTLGMSGVENSGSGWAVLSLCQICGNNSGFGAGFMWHDTFGLNNTGGGVDFMRNTIGGFDNSGIGAGALKNGAPLRNAVVGENVLIGQTTSTEHDIAGAGYSAMSSTSLTTAANIAFLGSNVLNHCQTCVQDAVVGANSAEAITGGFNRSLLGYSNAAALTGSYVSSIGASNIPTAVTSTGLVFISDGHGCDVGSSSESHEIVLCADGNKILTITGTATAATSVATFAGTLAATGGITNATLSIPTGTATFAVGSGVTSVACASGYSCNNTRGTLTIVGGTGTTGTVATVSFSAALSAAPACFVTQNGGGSLFDVGNGAPSTTAFTITAGLTVIGATFNVNYQCQP
jgi:hypothetical protein